MSLLQHYPSLAVELGAAFVLFAALLSRVLLSRFGVPSIVTLLCFGLAAGPSGFDLVHLDLTNAGTRALLQLAVVVVLFEATLRLDLRGIPKGAIALLTISGSALTLYFVPMVAHAYHFSELLSSMLSAICIVTGPTVIGPLMARLRPPSRVSHFLESEGLVLDALGVIIASAVFATYTSRPGTPLDAAAHVTMRIGAGVLVGLAWGFIGRFVLARTARASSDLSKMSVLFVGFSAFAVADALAHESGLVSVVVCGIIIDYRILPHERLLRVFKEDLSMLALSTVFVLLASQIRIQHLGPLVAPAAAIVGVLIAVRLVAVAVATFGSTFPWKQRVLMATVFPRGIVAVSLATYYATQIPAWGLHGGDRLAGILFLVVVFSIAASVPISTFASQRLKLQMPAVVVAGVTPSTLEAARRYKEAGHLTYVVDIDAAGVAFAQSHDFEAEIIEDVAVVADFARRRKAKLVIAESAGRWNGGAISVVTPAHAHDLLDS